MKRTKSMKRKVVFLDLMMVFPIFILFCVSLWLLFRDNNLSLNYSRLDVLEQKCGEIANSNMEIVKITNAFYFDSELNQLASKKEMLTGYSYLQSLEKMQSKMLELTGMFPDQQYQLMLLCENGNSYFQASLQWPDNALTYQELAQEEWYGKVEDSGDALYFLPKYRSAALESLFPENMLFAVRRIRNVNSGRFVGLLIVAVSQELWGGSAQSNERSFAIDQYGKIIFSSDSSLYGLNMEKNSYYEKIETHEKGFFLGNVNKVYSHIYFSDIPDTSWKLITCVPYAKNWSPYFLMMVGLGTAVMAVLIAIVFFNCNVIGRRMKRVNENILKVSYGDLQTRLAPDQYEQEFQELCVNFNTMLDCIERLIRQLSEEEKEKRALEIQALQAQINPHFLYNTLASIRFLAQMEEYEKADRAVVAFSRLLRRSFSDVRNIIPIREELDTVREYLELMALRYQDSFEWSIEIAPGTEKQGILKNTVQPLVENSISHGFNMKEQLGHIRIRTSAGGGTVLIEVEDDGVGVDLEKINRCLREKSQAKTREQFSGIGLSNIQMRIVRNFGKPYGLRAEKNERGGVTFYMTLPSLEPEEEA